MTSTNPWLTVAEQAATTEVAPRARRPPQIGASAPQSGVPVPDIANRLPRRDTAWPATLWWLGVHGGAGETTLARLATGTRTANHAWPIPTAPGTTHRVALVARNNYSGLIAAQRAAIEWASNSLGDSVQLVGLVLITDAPGRRPKTLRDLEQVIAGGVPRVWILPWVEAWRIAETPLDTPLPKEFHQLFAELSLTASSIPTRN